MAFSTAYMQLSAAASGRDQASVSISPEICGCVGNCRNHGDDFTVALHSHHHHHHHERDDEDLLHLFLEMQKAEDHTENMGTTTTGIPNSGHRAATHALGDQDISCNASSDWDENEYCW